MAKGKKKATRRKVIPLHFQKSHTSLSSILAASSYQRRIKQLSKNNKILAVALQDARCEIAESNKLLQQCSNDQTKIKLAKVRLKDMATSIQALVSGLDEVMSYLDLKPLGLYKKMPANEIRLKIKEPDMQKIDESASNSTLSDISITDDLVRNSLAKETVPMDTVQGDAEEDSMTEVYDCQASLQRINNEIKGLDALNASQVRNNSGALASAADSTDSPSTPQLELCHSSENLKLMQFDMQRQNLYEDVTPKQAISSPFKNKDKIGSKIPIPRLQKQNPLVLQPATAINRKTFVINVEKNPEPDCPAISDIITDNFDLTAMKSNERRGTYILDAPPKPMNNDDIKTSQMSSVQNNFLPINETVILCEDMELTEVLPVQNLPIIENVPPTKNCYSPKPKVPPIKSIDEHKVMSKSPPTLIKCVAQKADFVHKLFHKKQMSFISETVSLTENRPEKTYIEQKNSLSKKNAQSKTEKNLPVKITDINTSSTVANLKKSALQSEMHVKAVVPGNPAFSGDSIRKSPRLKSNPSYKVIESNSDANSIQDLKRPSQFDIKISRRKSLKSCRNQPYTLSDTTKTCNSIDKEESTRTGNKGPLISKKDILNFSSSFETDEDSPNKLISQLPEGKLHSVKMNGNLVSNKTNCDLNKDEKLTGIADQKLGPKFEIPPKGLAAKDKKIAETYNSNKCGIEQGSSITDIPNKEILFVDQITACNPEEMPGAIRRKSCMKISPPIGQGRVSRSSISRKSVRFNLNECIVAFQNIKINAEKSKCCKEENVNNDELEQAPAGIFSICHEQAVRKKSRHVRSSPKDHKLSSNKPTLDNPRKKFSDYTNSEDDANKLNEDLLKNIKESKVKVQDDLEKNLGATPSKNAGCLENIDLSCNLTLTEGGKRTFSGVSERRSKKKTTDTSIDLFDNIDDIIQPEVIGERSSSLEKHSPKKDENDCEETKRCNLSNKMDKPNMNQSPKKDKVKLKSTKKRNAKSDKAKSSNTEKPKASRKKLKRSHQIPSETLVSDFVNSDVLGLEKENKSVEIENKTSSNNEVSNLASVDSVPLKSLQINVSEKNIKGNSRKQIKKQTKVKNPSSKTDLLPVLKDNGSSSLNQQIEIEKKDGDVMGIENMQPVVLLEPLPLDQVLVENMNVSSSNQKDPNIPERRSRKARPCNLQEPKLRTKLRR